MAANSRAIPEPQKLTQTTCPCGQSWSDQSVSHLCQLINKEVLPLSTDSGRGGLATTSTKGSYRTRDHKRNTLMVSKTFVPDTESTLLSEPIRESSQAIAAQRRQSSENIQVFVRIRPLIEREISQARYSGYHSISATDHQTIEVRTSDSTIKCAYDAVFDHTFSQEQVYNRVHECTESFLQGFNSTLFAYGQTGSGKSFTMFGAETDLSRYRPGLQNSQAGIIPRAIKALFAATVRMEEDAQASIFCSFAQVYNEQIFDLLRDTQMATPLEIHEDRKHGIYVEGLSEYAVKGVSDCLQLLQSGEQNRAVRSTHMNQVSSRSHSVFQLLLEQRRKDGTVLKSKFNLVDLAGSEKWNLNTDMQENHITEMTNINLSLHTLGRCIASLSSKSTKGSTHVPYRDSKLTRLLQDSLGGNTKTKIIATLSPSLDCVDESISTLKFADRAKKVMVTVRVNEQREIDPAYVEKLQDELEQLREVLRLFRQTDESNEHSFEDEIDSSDNNSGHEKKEEVDRLKARVVQLVYENTELKHQIKKQQKEIESLGLQQSHQEKSVLFSSPTDSQLVQAKQNLENVFRQLKDASDRFFRYEIEEEELKTIHCRLFQEVQVVPHYPPTSISHSPQITNGRVSGGGESMRIRSCMKLRSSGSLTPPEILPAMVAAKSDLSYRVRGRSIDGNGSGGGWRYDTQSSSVKNIERELEVSRKAIEKQTKLQSWLIEKEKREIFKLQQEQQYSDEQRRHAAKKDAKFFKRAAETKKKLLLASSINMDVLDPKNIKPATAET
ncbi:putative kinesin-like protein [Plasmopara halstedii]